MPFLSRKFSPGVRRHSQEVKKLADSLRKRHEEYEVQQEALAAEHARIIASLREQALVATAKLDEQQQRHNAIELELGTLRGRLAHATKEQSEWESKIRQHEQMETEASMHEIRKLRRVNPQAAATLREERSLALTMSEPG